jgi:hypothetical protein
LCWYLTYSKRNYLMLERQMTLRKDCSTPHKSWNHVCWYLTFSKKLYRYLNDSWKDRWPSGKTVACLVSWSSRQGGLLSPGSN